MLLKIFNSRKALDAAAVDFDELVDITDDTRDQIHKILLEMYDDMLTVCNSLGITLYLIGGTALGAVRHKGFIPWDDDFDVALSRKDYFKFRDYFKYSDLSKKYILNAPNYSAYPKARFPQLIKKGTVFEDVNDCTTDKCLKGFKIDIFIIDNVPNNIFKRCLKGIRCNIMEFIASKVQGVESNSDIYKDLWLRAGRITYYLNNIIGKIFSIVKSTTWMNWIDRCIQYDDEDSKYCTIATGRKHYFKEILPRQVFYPKKEIEFCNRIVSIIHNPKIYLKNLYGDYMNIPPVEKRERHFIKDVDFGSDNGERFS